MAVIQPTIIAGPGDSQVITWQALGNADTGAPLKLTQFPDKTLTLTGTHGGATSVLEGSNDGATYGTLNDASATALSLTSNAGPLTILENPVFVRPATSGGTGTNLDFILVVS